MVESSRRKIPTRKRSRIPDPAPAVRQANLEGWVSDPEKRREFISFWKERKLLPNLLENQGLQLPNLLENQGLQHLIELKAAYYPDLVCIFYFNFKVRDDVAYTKENVAHLPIREEVVKVHIGVEGFNRILAYRSFLKNPQQHIEQKQLLVGGLKMDERLIHYLIVRILSPQATNHAQCSE
ncbi:hypothetical protein V8G54_005896 [Vigna mungo]|uniref:Uncharacterized protein n=1 Tax=Vigna mungo TaxID=3915 RepID=A0AAQ3S7I7_VIGMU